mgnify:CR=1 FL=1
MERIAVIGASGGLGTPFCSVLPNDCKILGIARKRERLSSLAKAVGPHLEWVSADITSDIEMISERLQQFQPTRIFYLAGGGPYGAFESKQWKDHLWAWEVSFLGAARVVHVALNFSERPKQIVLCGSAVAENEGDAGAAAYSSAKHALKGLYECLRAENSALDIRLFSPGYLDTGLLPKGAAIRYKGVWSSEAMAKELWTWACSNDHAGHRAYSPHP